MPDSVTTAVLYRGTSFVFMARVTDAGNGQDPPWLRWFGTGPVPSTNRMHLGERRKIVARSRATILQVLHGSSVRPLSGALEASLSRTVLGRAGRLRAVRRDTAGAGPG